MVANTTDADGIPRPTGLTLQPFRGLRYGANGAGLGRVLAPPYDVIDATQREELLRRDPHNVVRLTLPDSRDGVTDYAAAASTLAQWRREGVLHPDARPALYVYEQATGEHTQRGLLGALALSPAEDGIVLPHENTMTGTVADRLALQAATEANLEPIFCVYDGGGPGTQIVAEVDGEQPAADAADVAGTTHRLWTVSDTERLQAIEADLRNRRALIADGHHRYATYLQGQRDRHAAGGGSGPWDFGLTFLVDSGSFGPQVHAIHRVIPRLSPQEAAARAANAFTVTPVEPDRADQVVAASPEGVLRFALTDGDRAWLLTDPAADALAQAMPAERSPAWQRLPVSVATQLLFRQVWGLDDREGVVDYVHDPVSAVQAARSSGGTAVLLPATPVSAVAAVAAAGDRMPRKSTLFVPKPATGMVLRAFADQS